MVRNLGQCGGNLTHFLLEDIADIDKQLELTSANEVDSTDESDSFVKILGGTKGGSKGGSSVYSESKNQRNYTDTIWFSKTYEK